MKIKKVIIPVAGMGTRFLPITKASPKEMLPIIDKPVIHYIVQEAVDSGIEEVVFVTGKGKRAIEDYFDTDHNLINELSLKKKDKELKELKSLENIAKIAYVRQSHPLGDGHALLCAEHCIAPGEDFAVLFGDDIIDSQQPALSQLLEVYEQLGSSVIGVQDIQGQEIENYGVVAGDIKDNFIKINGLQEKPAYQDALSSMGIIGKYVCTNNIFQAIRNGKTSDDGELRLIDGFKHLLENKEIINACIIQGKRYDTGSKQGWLQVNIDFAKKVL